mgnify:CR=1 FL=1
MIIPTKDDIIRRISSSYKRYFLTGIAFFDKHGGFPLYEITEICGAAGAGKTILLHQLAFRFLYSYREGIALYIDADKSFNPKRIVKLCLANSIEARSLLSRIYVYQINDLHGMMRTVIGKIKENASDHEVLLIIDSVPTILESELLFKDEEAWSSEYLHTVVKLGVFLQKISDGCTIVVSNQVRAYIKEDKSLMESKVFGQHIEDIWTVEKVVPALGRVWELFIDNRFYIKKLRRDRRLIITIFSSSYPETFGMIKFRDEFFE